MKICGQVHIFGDNVDTDVIIPARYLTTSDEKTLATHCMEDIDKTFSARVKSGDVIVAGFNFGSGSSREHAPIAIRASGVQAVIAKSFARIFYRNSINTGLLVIEDEILAQALATAKTLSIDYNLNQITNTATGEVYNFDLPDFVKNILSEGGLTQTVLKGGL